MKYYENVLILKPETTIKDLFELTNETLKIIKRKNIFVVEPVKINDLCYEIKGYKQGFYIIIYLVGEPAKIIELEKMEKENKNFLKCVSIEIDLKNTSWKEYDFKNQLHTFINKDFVFLEDRTIRKCNECKKEMLSGYCIDNGLEYYCSDNCLYKNYTKEQYNDLYENDIAYWTEWEEDQ